MWAIFHKEINSFLHSILGYVFAGVFLLSTGLIMWIFPATNVLSYGYADMGAFFDFAPHAFLLLIPALSMRSFAEERRLGTLELLFCAPIPLEKIILGKYLAINALLLLCLLPSLCYFISLYLLGSPMGNIDGAQAASGYLGLWFVGASFAAIGVCISSICKSQVVAFILTAFLCFVLYGGVGSLALLDPWGEAGSMGAAISLETHYQALSLGVIALSEVIFFVVFCGFFLFLTHQILGGRR